ncbi:MAG: hypothetical protein BIFFINMI_03424 [Phycisphaerae bacterium]|nr:hypothetical protein [Phycisphaerae bacterium]
MTPGRIRLIALSLIVLIAAPWIVLRQMDQASASRESREGKISIVHYWGYPRVATTPNDQILIAIYQRFLEKPENRNVIIDRFSGLEIRDLPASWDAMMQMAFAAGRAPDILQLVTENIMTHRAENFIRPLPDRFTFVYSNSAYDDDAGYRRDAIERFRRLRARLEQDLERRNRQAQEAGEPDEKWLPQAALDFDREMMRQVQAMSADRLPGARPRLAELLEVWTGLMVRSGQPGLIPGPAPDAADVVGGRLTPDEAWARWLFEKLQARIPGELLQALFDFKTARLYGADEGQAAMMGLNYRIKPLREADLMDRGGRPLLPQTWDELMFWSVAVSLMGDGASSDGKFGYKMAHANHAPYPFPLYAYGAGGQIAVQNADGVWSAALDSPGTIRGMEFLQKFTYLKPIKLDLLVPASASPDGAEHAWPLVLMYHTKNPYQDAVPDFYLRAPGNARQVVIRRLTLDRDRWQVRDRDRVLFGFAGRQDLINRIGTLAGKSSQGACQPVITIDNGDLEKFRQLWDEDNIAMSWLTSSTLVVSNPDAQGQTRHPDGASWDLMVSEDDLAGPKALAALGQRLAAIGVKGVDLNVSDADWQAIDAYLRRQAVVKDPAQREALAGQQPPRLARLIADMDNARLPIGCYYGSHALEPSRPAWAGPMDLDLDRNGKWTWVHLVAPADDLFYNAKIGRVIVTSKRLYVVERPEYEAWPGGPRFTMAPEISDDGAYAQFPCGLQAPADGVREIPTWRIQVAVADMGLLALNHRLNESTPADREKLDAAVRLITYVSSDEAEEIRVRKSVENGLGTTLNPVLLRKYGYDDIADQIPPEYEKAMRNIYRVGRAVPALPNYRGFQQFLASLADRVVIEGQDPADACRTVNATTNKRFLTDPNPNLMQSRRRIAWVVFGVVGLGLLLAAFFMARQLVVGLSSHAGVDADLGSVGQRTTWRTHLAAWLFLGPAVATIALWSYVPLAWGSVMAFQDFHIVQPTHWIGLDNFIRIFVDPEFYKVLGNTLWYVFLALSLGFLAPIFLALLLNEIPWARIFFRTVFYLPAITSGLVILFMWKKFYDTSEAGLLNTLLLRLNELPLPAVFALKLLGILLIPAVIVALFNLPLMDNIETKLGRSLAAALPVAGTLWLGFRAPGDLLPLPAGLAGRTLLAFSAGGHAYRVDVGPLVWAIGAIALFVAGLGMLRAAFACEHEFSSRRIPWAWPAIVLLFAAGWLLRQATGAEVSPLAASSHMAQLFLLLLPLTGLWPLLRRLLGREHTPRETMYLVLRAKTKGTVPFSARGKGDCPPSGARRASIVLGLAVAIGALAAFACPGSPMRLAFYHLFARLPGYHGWLFRPFIFEPLLWLKDKDLAMICIILPGVWAGMGPGCLIYLAGLKGIPDEVYEAADLDGASAMQKAWTITFPHLAALMIINFVGAFIGAFQSSQNVLVMTAGGPADATMVLGLRVWLDAFVLLKFGYATALAWILGLMLIGFTMYQISILKRVEFKTAGR